MRDNVVGNGHHFGIPIAFYNAGKSAKARTKKRHPIPENNDIGFDFFVFISCCYPVEWIDRI